MKDLCFNNLLDGIYSTFNRTKPAYNTLAYSNLRKRVEEKYVPDEAVPFIISRFEDYDNLPTNLGKAIIREFGEWLSQNPQKKILAQSSCGFCDVENSGFFYAHDGYKHFLCKCPCNTDERFSNIQAVTKFDLQQRGWQKTTGRDDQNLEYWSEQVRLWRQGLPYYSPTRFKGVLGQEEQASEAHEKYMQENEW